MAHPLGALVVGEPDDVLDSRAHVLGVLYDGLSQAARIWLAERHGSAGNSIGFRLLGIFVADGRTELFRDQGRPGDSGGNSLYWAVDCEYVARRARRERVYGA